MTTARQLWDVVRSYVLGPFKLSEMKSWLEGYTTSPTGAAAINEDTALTLSAVWNAVQIIAGTVGSLPCELYKRTPDGDREVMRKHPLYRILHDQPNPEMSAMTFRETLQAHVLTWGNAFAEIRRNGANHVAALWPLYPSRVTVNRDGAGRLYYEVRDPANQKTTRLEPNEILHIKGPSPDGVLGYSVIGKARESLGYSVATERFGSAFYSNATIHGGVVKHPGRLSEQAHTRLLRDLEARHKGGVNAFKLAILEEGMAWESMGMPLSDAQFLESRTFQIQEIARWFNIPLHMLKELTHATFSNIEHQALEFVQHTLRPWLVKWEQEMNSKLVLPLEYGVQFVEHNVEGLLRGDIESRYRAYATARNWGWMNANTICRKENLPRLPDEQGDIYLVPANMIPAARILDEPEPPPPPPAPAAPAPAQEDEEEPEEGERAMPPPAVIPVNGHERRRAQLISAQRMLIADVVRRHLAREKDKARTAATHGRPERVRAWMSEFYPKYADHFRGALLPAIQLHVALVGSEADPETVTRQFTEAHVAESRRQLWMLLEQPSEDLRAAVDELMARWDIERINTIPDALMVEEITHGL
jgi:HK97 family phage portal protein